jgi:hypothetical protein
MNLGNLANLNGFTTVPSRSIPISNRCDAPALQCKFVVKMVSLLFFLSFTFVPERMHQQKFPDLPVARG